MRAILILMLSAGVAYADAKEDAYKAIAVKIATAHICKDVTGDNEPFKTAVAEAPQRLISAGYSDAEANEKLQIILSALGPHATEAITPQLCGDMLRLMK